MAESNPQEDAEDQRTKDEPTTTYKETETHAGDTSDRVTDADIVETLLSDQRSVPQSSPVLHQMMAVAVSSILAFSVGLTIAFTSILMPQLRGGVGIIYDSLSMDQVLIHIGIIAVIIGCLVSGWLMEQFGRRTSLFIICALLLLGWILVASTNSILQLLAGLFFTQVCVGLAAPLSPVFIGEITDPKLRGFFITGLFLPTEIGSTVMKVGSILTWQSMGGLCCVLPVGMVALSYFISESPVWFISKGRIEEGVKAYRWFRGYSDQTNTELRGILENQLQANSQSLSVMQKLRSPELLKPWFITTFFFLVSVLSLHRIVRIYSIEIVHTIDSSISYLPVVFLEAGHILMSQIACVVNLRFGRRPVFLISGVVSALSLIGLSAFILVSDGSTRFYGTYITWLPMFCLAMHMCATTIGLVPLSWIMCGEVFPVRARGLGSSTTAATYYIAEYTMAYVFQGIVRSTGFKSVFLILGGVVLIGTGVLFYILPETKGKSLLEVEQSFVSKSRQAFSLPTEWRRPRNVQGSASPHTQSQTYEMK